jgi:hypothetical protein
MIRTATLGAALALLMTSAASAQTGEPPAAGETPPPVVQPAEPGAAPEVTIEPAPAEEPDEPAMMMDDPEEAMDGDRPHWRDGDRRHHRRAERRGGRDEHHGRGHRGMHAMMQGMHHMQRGREGASFRFSEGDGGPTIRIECADRDTTQECVEAIMPMLEMVLPNR